MKRRSLFWVIAFAVVAAFGCSRSHERPTASPLPLNPLTVDQVATRLAAHDGKTFIYDNNPKDIYDAGHVPGAKWVKFDEVTAAALPGDRSATLIFYCRSEA
jgi:Rhodanese-like domain